MTMGGSTKVTLRSATLGGLSGARSQDQGSVKVYATALERLSIAAAARTLGLKVETGLAPVGKQRIEVSGPVSALQALVEQKGDADVWVARGIPAVSVAATSTFTPHTPAQRLF